MITRYIGRESSQGQRIGSGIPNRQHYGSLLFFSFPNEVFKAQR